MRGLTPLTGVLQEESSRITVQATGATSWRRGDVKYKKNEAFVDVIETVNLSMSAKGADSINAYDLILTIFQAISFVQKWMVTS